MTTKSVSAASLKAMLHDGEELALLDVREAGEFGQAHLLFAIPLPYSRLELDIPGLVPRRTTRIVLCDDGDSGIAARALKRLEGIGYSAVHVLEGGTRGWAAAGHTLFAGVNVPSKLFGELVEHTYHTPRITVHDLARMKQSGENVVIVDGRPFAEYQKMNIPGGICCPNAELPYRIGEIAKDANTKIVVNCAGRTRSILGAQTLINFGVPNAVYALENGTQGWVLADMALERGASRRYPDRVDERDVPRLREQAQVLARRYDVRTVSANEARAWLEDGKRTTYLLDVRTPEEFEAGSLAGALHAPGGQLVQATDQWVGVRNARIVLIDSEGVRAPVVASWLRQLGFEACVLEGGVRADVSAPAPERPCLPSLPAVSPAELKRMVDRHTAQVIDLGSSMRFRKAHIPGSCWSIRPQLAAGGAPAAHPANPAPAAARARPSDDTSAIVLVADDENLARLAAIDLREAGATGVKLLDGGFSAWTQAGYATEASPDVPPDSQCIDYLFFVHDRHAGNREAMRQYLQWETGLIAQLDSDDRKLFRVGAGR